MKLPFVILVCLFGLRSLNCYGQTGKPFIFHSTNNEQNGISSATVLPGGKFAYAYTGQWFFKIIITDTGGNELLSRKFTGQDLDNCKLIYHKGFIYGISNSYIDADSAFPKFGSVIVKLDTCLNLVASKLVYNKNPIKDYMYIQTNYWNNPASNENGEFFFPLTNINKRKTWSQYRNALLIFDTLLNIKYSPYYPASETIYSASKSGKYILTGYYYQMRADSSIELLKPFYSELNPVNKQCDMWVIEQFSDSVFGSSSGLFDPDNHKMYVSLNMYKTTGYTHGVVDYSNLEAAEYTILSDTTVNSGYDLINYNWSNSDKFTIVENTDFKNAKDMNGFITIRTFNAKLKQSSFKKIYGWGNLKNGLDDTFSMITWGTTKLTENKLLIFGETRDNFYRQRSFYYVIDSNSNFATKTVDTSKYHCNKNRILPAIIISPKDTFYLTNDMFEEAKVIVHNIKLGKMVYMASIAIIPPLQTVKSKQMIVKYLPDNKIECSLIGSIGTAQYKLMDMSAKTIQEGTTYDNTICFNQIEFTPGVYTVVVIKNKEVYTQRILMK